MAIIKPNNNTLSAITALPFGTGITNSHQWRVTTDFTGSQQPIASNWEQADTDGYGGIGSVMSQSSGVFTFPSTGIYYIVAHAVVHFTGSIRYWRMNLETTTDNSSFDTASLVYGSINNVSNKTFSGGTCNFIFDVTNTTTHKVRLSIEPENNSTTFQCSTSNNGTDLTFIRLGDT